VQLETNRVVGHIKLRVIGQQKLKRKPVAVRDATATHEENFRTIESVNQPSVSRHSELNKWLQ